MRLSIRKAVPTDFPAIVDYFRNSSDEFLLGMGVERSKMLSREEWLELLNADFEQELSKRQFYYLIWLVDDLPVAHSNINKILFGKEAYTHMHVWYPSCRCKGLGFPMMKMCLDHYFSVFHLKDIFCEPYTLNVAPNKVLEKLGFNFINEYETIPGWIAFMQPVKRWCMPSKKFYQLYGDINYQEVTDHLPE